MGCSKLLSSGRVLATILNLGKSGTTPGLNLFGTFVICSSLAAAGCARPVEERTASEKKVRAAHRRTLNLAKEEKNDPRWQEAAAEVAREPEDILARTTSDTSQPLGRLVRGSHLKKKLLLTFDDGPHSKSTPVLLRILHEEKVPATFFVIGKMAVKRPDLIQAIHQAGQTLANHSFSHVTLSKLSPEDQRIEYRANNDYVKKLTGVQMRFCRPPGGDLTSATIRAGQDEGLTTVLWTDDPGDFANPGDGIVLDRTLKRLSNGGVILLHDGSPNTMAVLRELIHEAKERGFSFATPQEMVRDLGELQNPVAAQAPRSLLAEREPAKRGEGR